MDAGQIALLILEIIGGVIAFVVVVGLLLALWVTETWGKP